MRLYIRSALALAMTLAVGCASVTPRERAAQAYDQVRERWTRKDKLLNRFDLQLSICATYLSKEFRRARREYLAVLYALSPGEVQKLEEKDADESGRGEAFLVGVFVPDRKHDKLDRKMSPWHLRMLVDDLEPLTPIEIRRTKISAPDRDALYPHLEIWDRVYTIVFPKARKDGSPAIPPGARKIKLALDGPLGTVRLVWNLQNLASEH